MSLRGKSLVLTIAGSLLAASAFAGVVRPNAGNDDLVPTGKGWGEHHAQGQARGGGKGGGGSDNGIFYHGGPVMLGTVNVYIHWYGGWGGNNAVTILEDLGSNIGGTPYFNLNSTSFDGSNTHLSNDVFSAGSTTDAYSRGTALSDSGVQGVVADAINSGRLPKDTHAVYFVLTSADVNETSGFCTRYCGWHTHGTIAGSDIRYSFVGNPERCPSACTVQGTVSPNGNVGADGMASILAHELEEAATDPDLHAWYDRRGQESADKCAWTFGATDTVANGSSANVRIGNRDDLIQQNWVNASGGFCSMSF